MMAAHPEPRLVGSEEGAALRACLNSFEWCSTLSPEQLQAAVEERWDPCIRGLVPNTVKTVRIGVLNCLQQFRTLPFLPTPMNRLAIPQNDASFTAVAALGYAVFQHAPHPLASTLHFLHVYASTMRSALPGRLMMLVTHAADSRVVLGEDFLGVLLAVGGGRMWSDEATLTDQAVAWAWMLSDKTTAVERWAQLLVVCAMSVVTRAPGILSAIGLLVSETNLTHLTALAKGLFG